MKVLFVLLSLLACVALLVSWARGFSVSAARARVNTFLTVAFHAPVGFLNALHGGAPLALANLGVSQHGNGKITYKADAAIATRYFLVKIGSDAAHCAVLAATSDRPVGICTDEPAAAEDLVNVDVLGASAETKTMVASGVIAAGATVVTDSNGKVQTEPTVAGTYWIVGTSITASAADGDLFEVEPCRPIRLVVVAAFTSTNGTAAAASGSLANLAAEAEKIGDDVRALGTALATPALVKVLT